MGVWDKIRAAVSRRPKAQADPLHLLSSRYGSGFGGASGRTHPAVGASEALELYAKSPWLRANAGFASRTVASHGWHVYRPTGASAPVRHQRSAAPNVRRAAVSRALADGELAEIPHHQMALLIERPNALLSGREMRQTTIASYDIAGEAAWVITRNGVGAPDAIFPVPGTWVLEFPSRENPTYRIRMGGTDWPVPASDVIMMVDPNPANPYGRGVGLGVAMGDELDIDEYAAKTISAWFQNRAMPDAIVSLKGASPDALRRAQETWAALQQGFRNAHRTHFVSGEIEVNRLDASFADQQLVEMRTRQRDTIQQIFGIPPEQLGIMINSNRAASEAAEMHGARNVQLPRLEVLRIAYQRVANMFDDRLVVEYDDPIPADKEAQLRAMQAFPGRFTIDEERAMAGLPELADGSGAGFFVPQGFTYVRSPQATPAPFQAPAQPSSFALGRAPLPVALPVMMRRDLTAGDIQRALNAIDGADIGGIIVPAVEELMQVWGDETLGQLAESIDTQPSAASIDLESEAVREKMKELAEERIARLINGVTKEELRAVLQEAFETGKPVDEIKKDVTAFFNKAKAERSAVIAETEAVNHANFAGIEALEQSGIPNIGKEWIATPDGRTRPEHRELDGQTRDLRTPFTIEDGPFAGAKANHPGGFGIAEQDIMCRCTVGTVIEELRSAELVTRGIALPRESTAEQRAAYWRARDAKLVPLEAQLKAAMDEAFDAQLEAVLATI